MIEDYVGKVINGDCIEVMAKMPESSVDLIVTSPPYGVGIAYDSFNDDIEFEQYKFEKSDKSNNVAYCAFRKSAVSAFE